LTACRIALLPRVESGHELGHDCVTIESVSPLLWVMVIGLAVVGGLLALARALNRSGAAAVIELANSRFTTMPFGELPGWARQRLAGLREQFLALGFVELTNYTRHSPRTNYTCVLIAPDGTTSANVWVARNREFALWLVLPMLGWSAFKNELLAAPRYGLMTHFPDGRVLETSPVEILAKSQVAGEMEFVIVPHSMPLAEVTARHEAAVQAFATEKALAPVSITSAEGFLTCERELAARMAAKLRRDLAIPAS